MPIVIKREMAEYIERVVGLTVDKIEQTGIDVLHRFLERKSGHRFKVQKESGTIGRGNVLLHNNRIFSREDTEKRFNKRFS